MARQTTARPKNESQRLTLIEKPQDIRVGVVGLGLMGTSIVACLLSAGHKVIGFDKDATRRSGLRRRTGAFLREMCREGVAPNSVQSQVKNLALAKDFTGLRDCSIVIEAVRESLSTKRQVIRKIEMVVPTTALIGSNTSGLPVTDLQRGARHPERIMGIHWAEPAHITRFMEIICGNETSPKCADRIFGLARLWNKEPTLVRRDIRGFITNRIMYAMIREAFHLVEGGYATPADVDRSLRNDLGYWITFAGPFRFMDLTGIPAYAAVMRHLLADLDCSKKTPKLMSKVANSGAKGVTNCRGFYRYTPAQAKRWQKLFLKFSYEIRKLALKYPEDIGDRHFNNERSNHGEG